MGFGPAEIDRKPMRAVLVRCWPRRQEMEEAEARTTDPGDESRTQRDLAPRDSPDQIPDVVAVLVALQGLLDLEAAGARRSMLTSSRMRPGRAVRTTTRSPRSMSWVTKTMVLPVRSEARELLLHGLASLGVEGAEGLVHQQNLGIEREDAREGDALLHAAGELGRVVVAEFGEADHFQVGPNGFFDLVPGKALGFQTPGHISSYGFPREEREFLEHDPAVGAGAVDVPAMHADLALTRP